VQLPPVRPTESNQRPSPRQNELKRETQWVLCNPEPGFALLAPAFQWLRPVAPALAGALIIGLTIALYLFFHYADAFHRDLHSYRGGMSYLGLLIINLLTVNLLRCLVQGLVCAAHQVPIPEFGIRLRFGVLPRFYIDKSRVREVQRSSKLWIYATSPLLRIVLITIGVCLWAQFRETSRPLSVIGAWMGHAGFMGLLFVAIPLWNSDGYRWLAAFLNLPPRFRQNSLQALSGTLRGRPLPVEIPAHRRSYYLACGLVFAIGWTFLLIRIATLIVRGLHQSFPVVLGHSSQWIFLGVVAGAMALWVTKKLRHTEPRPDCGPKE
jgi:hypothetical protein